MSVGPGDDDDPSVFYRHRLLEEGSATEDTAPVIEYHDKYGNNVTPMPLLSEGEMTEIIEKNGLKGAGEARRRMPPRKQVVIKSLLHMATALYSMAGLGSIEESKLYKDMERAEEEEKAAAAAAEAAEAAAVEAAADEDEDGLGPSEKTRVIDILLVESDTIWMLVLPGTCVEIDPDAKESKDDEDGDDAPNGENGDKKEEKAKKKKRSKQESSFTRKGKYELVESWSQTLDFSKKKKGTQCDTVEAGVVSTQVSTKDFLDEERRRQRPGGGASPSPKSPMSKSPPQTPFS